MARKAQEQGRTERELADEMSSHFKAMCDDLNVRYERFIRTVEPDHQPRQPVSMECHGRGGGPLSRPIRRLVCVRDEAYYGEKELIDGEEGAKLSPEGTPVEWTVEESWFFRLSNYQERLLELYRDHPEFLKPDSRPERNDRFRFRGFARPFDFAHELRLGCPGSRRWRTCHVCLGRCVDELPDRFWFFPMRRMTGKNFGRPICI